MTILHDKIFENDKFMFYVTSYQNSIEELHRFFENGFERHFTSEALSWFNLKYPGGMNRIYIAREKDKRKIVSALCFHPLEYQWKGKICGTSICTNAVTHADFRHQGLFLFLNRLSYEQEAKFGTEFNISFPRRKEALSGFIKSGWNEVFELGYWEKRNTKNLGGSATVPVNLFDERFDELYKSASSRFDFIHIKSNAILNWRYIYRPDKKYYVYAVIKKNNVKGFIVLKRYSSGEEKKSHIVDFIAEDEVSANILIDKAESFSENDDLLNLWMSPGSPYSSIFSERGYKLSNNSDNNSLIMRGTKGNDMCSIKNPWIVLGDNDVY